MAAVAGITLWGRSNNLFGGIRPSPFFMETSMITFLIGTALGVIWGASAAVGYFLTQCVVFKKESWEEDQRLEGNIRSRLDILIKENGMLWVTLAGGELTEERMRDEAQRMEDLRAKIFRESKAFKRA
jgi:hypothetical protein